jgi:hypothetical protein
MNTNYETLKEAGYTYHTYIPKIKMHVLINNDTGKKELFIARKWYAGWAIKYKNTHLEFIGSAQEN